MLVAKEEYKSSESERRNTSKRRETFGLNFAAMLLGSLGSEMSGQQNKVADTGIPPKSKRQTNL